MKECTSINELLSAYFDGELTESEKRIVEKHIASCDECSAVLDIYSEISNTTSSSSIAVPEGLHIGVMNRIQHENIAASPVAPVVKVKEKKRKRFNTVITRLVPIAACLAVVLAGWQLWGNWDSIFGADFAAEAPASEAVAEGSLWDYALAEEEADFFDDDSDARLAVGVGIYATLDDLDDEDAEITQDATPMNIYPFQAEVLEPIYGYDPGFGTWLFISNTTSFGRHEIGGKHFVIISDFTEIFDADYNPISYTDILSGTIVEIHVYGEILESDSGIAYAPGIVYATLIQIIE